MRKALLSTAVAEQRQSLLRAVATLPDDAWDVVCPNPAAAQGVVRLDEPVRTVRDLVAHVCVVDGLSLGANPVRPWDALWRLEMPSGWDRRRVMPFLDLSPSDLLGVLARSGDRVVRMVSATPPAMGRLPVTGPFGRQPLVQLVTQRVLHEWLHERDVVDAIAGGPPRRVPSPQPAVAEAIVDVILAMMPEQVLPRADADGGVVRLIIDIDSGASNDDGVVGARRVWAADFARRHYGPRVVVSPDATVRMDAATLALLTNGRWDRVGWGNCVMIDGDEALGKLLLDAIRRPIRSLPSPGLDDDRTVTTSP
ncbi:MAG: hypothetical protein GEU74_07580 [Nitriliruptorales bacterium]|nr:hypothetical protein [Nitriliruptorales bacterium]